MPSDSVVVQISVDSLGVARQGFGIPMLVSHKAAFVDRVRTYRDLPGVAADFDTDSPEYLWARAQLSQTPKPTQIMIGRASGAVTQRYEVGIDSVRNTYAYKLTISGENVAEVTVSFTSDANATNDEIVAGLLAAVNGIAGKTFTATATGSAGSQKLTITADSANAWFSVALFEVTTMRIVQNHAAPSSTTLATDLAAILEASGDWYQVHTLYNSTAYALAVAAWTEANGRTYVFDTNETANIKDTYSAGVTTDVGSQMLAAGYTTVAGAYHPSPAAMLASAWMGRWLPTSPGQATAKFKSLNGPAFVVTTANHRANLLARRMQTYVREYGRSHMNGGMVFSTVYRYIDVRRDVDWLTDVIATRVFGILAGSDKVPFTQPGLNRLEGGIRGGLDEATTADVLALGTTFVEMPTIDQVSPSDKADRTVRTAKFSGTLTGAVEAVIPLAGVVTF